MSWSRRRAIQAALFGAGGLGLRSLATGIPMKILADPLRARAQDGVAARTLILSASSAGDPLGANVPGTYLDGIAHPPGPEMARSDMVLGGQTYAAAKPWADLPAEMRNQMCFFHHGTLTNSHPNHPKVMRLMGSTASNDMFVSDIARELASVLGTVQVEPLTLGARGSELVSFRGRILSNVSPLALKEILGREDSPLASLQSLRDAELDRLNTLFKAQGSPNQQLIIDRFAQTRREARNLSEELITRLADVSNNNVAGQVAAAPVLAAMNVAPVITLKIPFGGDNHNDANLARETTQTVAGVGYLASLYESLKALQGDGSMKQDFVIATLNVFGRTLQKKGTQGRDHNGNRHAMVMIGSSVKPTVIGGIERVKPDDPKKDWRALPINSSTGEGSVDGDVPFDETLGAVAKTLGAMLGLSREKLDEIVETGKVIEPAVG